MRAGLRRVVHHPVLWTALLAVAFALLVAPSGRHTVSDPDVFWIAATGRDIVQRHAMPIYNGYSYADANHPWVMHEGLYALLFFEAARAVSPAVFSLIGVVSAACIVFVAMVHLFGQSRSTLAAGVCAAIVLSGYKGLFSPRPGYASLVLAVGMIAIAARPGWTRARAMGAVLVELVWTNAHGSFPIGVALLGVAAFDDGRSGKERRAWLVTAGAAALVTLLNPYGIELHGLVRRYLYADDPTAHLIQENITGFRPLWIAWDTGFANRPMVPGIALLAALSVYALARRRHVARALLVLAAVGMGIYQVRHGLLAVVMGPLLILPCVDELALRWPFGDVAARAPAPDPRRAPWIALGVALPTLVLGGSLWTSAMRTRPPDEWIGASLGGPAFVRSIRGVPSGVHLYAPFSPSALVLWYDGNRGVQVLFDPRNDCYSPRVALAAFPLGRAHVNAARALQTLEENDTQYAIVPTPGPLADALASSASWDPWSRDHGWVGFRRRSLE